MKTFKTIALVLLLAVSASAKDKPKTVVVCYVATLSGNTLTPVRTNLNPRRAAELAHDLNTLSGKRGAIAVCDVEPAGDGK